MDKWAYPLDTMVHVLPPTIHLSTKGTNGVDNQVFPLRDVLIPPP